MIYLLSPGDALSKIKQNEANQEDENNGENISNAQNNIEEKSPRKNMYI